MCSKEFQNIYAHIPLYLRVQEFLTKDGKQLTKWFYKVQASGGINRWLGIDNPIIPSFIMANKRCNGLTSELATTLLKGLNVSKSTTLDTYTYLNLPHKAKGKLRELQQKNALLLKMNPDVHFQGIVKGSTQEQNRLHIQELQDLGITEFIFHAGDYICQGTKAETRAAQVFAWEIRKRVDHLIIYGIGAKKWIDTFSFADSIVTLNHIIEPHNGVFTTETGKIVRQRHQKRHPTQTTFDQHIAGFPQSSLDATLFRNSPWNSFRRIHRDFANRDRSSTYATALCIDGGEECSFLSTICLTCPHLLRGCC
ncbi:MAG TPA: hypothetical protein O0Y06_07650 [Methanocorpusculum sp.]|nr:hypothetical protein [Methanocorpusculum sp.]HJK80760.1 hypothetical protein [Methanocorpusculum sp.]